MDYKFSIITVCFNEEKIISKTIESVLKQTWKSFEYIIVDGASQDKTISIISDYAKQDKRIRWYSEKDTGIYNAMNKGIRYAEGEFIYFLNAGDLLYDNTVLEKVGEVINISKADIVIGNIVTKCGTKLIKTTYDIGEKLYKNLKNRENVCHQAIFASKDSLKEGFDEKLKICADYNWLCKQINNNKKIEKVNAIVVNYDINGFSYQPQNRKLLIRECMEIMKKNFPETNLKNCDELEYLAIEKEKNRFLYKFMNQWVILKQRKIDISSFFINKGIKKIAIYGIHYMGERLYDELKNTQVEILYAIDRNKDKKEWEIPIIQPNDSLEYVEAIIVTPIFDFIEIKNYLLEKCSYSIFSIEEILFYKYY